jgi:hypothetical protein
MKVSYLNDEQRPITLRILDANYDGATGTGDTYMTLQSCEMKVFEVNIPEDCILFVKKWPNMVMFSYTSASVQPQSTGSQPYQDKA